MVFQGPSCTVKFFDSSLSIYLIRISAELLILVQGLVGRSIFCSYHYVRWISTCLGLFIASVGQTAPAAKTEKDCAKSLISIAQESNAKVKRLDNPLQKQVDLEVQKLIQDVDSITKKSYESCLNSGRAPLECIDKAGNEATAKVSFGKRLAEFAPDKKTKACLTSLDKSSKQKFLERSNTVLNLSAMSAATLLFHEMERRHALAEGREAPKFNFAIIGVAVVFTVYRSAITCKNVFDNSALDGSKTKAQLLREKFWRYTKMSILENSTFVGMLAAQDALRGEDVFEEDNLKSYATDFAFGMVWNAGMAGLHMAFLDRFLIQGLDGIRYNISRWIARGWIRPVVVRAAGKTKVIVRVSYQIPAFVVDTTIRTALTAGRMWVYLDWRKHLLEALVPGKYTQEEDLPEKDVEVEIVHDFPR